MTLPKISVIIPTWNRQNTLGVAIQSALQQSLEPLEILVCDDGSTDQSRELVKAIPDQRVRWLEGPRGGTPGFPRNRGAAQAQGEWLAFLDSDDEWLPTKLEKQLKVLQEGGGEVASTNGHRRLPGRQELSGTLLNWTASTIRFEDLIQNNQVIVSSVVIHRSLFERIGGFPTDDKKLRGIEDYALWLRVTAYEPIHYCPEPLLIYCDDPVQGMRAWDPADEFYQKRQVFRAFFRWQSGRRETALRSLAWKLKKHLGKLAMLRIKVWLKTLLFKGMRF